MDGLEEPACIALIALMRRFLSPSGIPSFSRSPSVNSVSTSLSIAFSMNADAYRPKPSSRSQPPMSTGALRSSLIAKELARGDLYWGRAGQNTANRRDDCMRSVPSSPYVISRAAWGLTAILVLPTRFDLLVAAVLLSLIEQELDAILGHTLTGAPPVLLAHVRRRVPILHALLEVFGAAFQYFIWRPYAGNLGWIPGFPSCGLCVGCRAAGKQQRCRPCDKACTHVLGTHIENELTAASLAAAKWRPIHGTTEVLPLVVPAALAQQAKTTVRVANVPQQAFEKAVGQAFKRPRRKPVTAFHGSKLHLSLKCAAQSPATIADAKASCPHKAAALAQVVHCFGNNC